MAKQIKVIHCEEIAVDPILITLGDNVQIDVANVSAYNSIRVLELIQRSIDGTATDEDATNLVHDIVSEQHPEIDVETLLKSGNQTQLTAFINAVIINTIRTYQPFKRYTSPFADPELKPGLTENKTAQ